MQVVILCGGKGTRLREETEYRPKPMVPVGDFPILWHIMKSYAHYGHKEFILCLGYKGHVIKDFFLNYRFLTNDITLKLGPTQDLTFHGSPTAEDWTITLADTGEDTMTGGRVKRIEKYIKGDTFMLTYGDGVGNIDIKGLLEFHHKHGRLATLTGVRPPGRFGELMTTDSLVTEFNEKPQTSSGRINGGFFVFSREAFKYLSADAGSILEQEPLRKLAADKQLMCFPHDGFWQPMDTFREFEMLNQLWSKQQAPWKVW
ncbi:MAG: Glucose-phosphate cytidylyltransferase [Pedosphaera sp.]|nr:Glucose-phosphate cytidylyltransferase [Pedosphaera sp.]